MPKGHFQSYIEYVSLADGIDVMALMDELEILEGRAYARLATGNSLALAEWSNDLRLADRAVQHALTPREWARFEERRGDLARLADRAAALGISRASAETLQTNLPRFAAFFEAAAARNHTLLENALAEAHRQGATAVALVTGGFHAPALEKLLNHKNISHMVLTPRIEEIPDSAAGYLQAFAPTRTPLEKLLLGDRLFMNPPSATAVEVNKPGSEFQLTGKALKNAELTYGAVVATSAGKLESFVALWNERFGEFGRAVVQYVKGVIEIRILNNQTALLLATAGSGGGLTDEELGKQITGLSGKVVETGQIGDNHFALGGRNITSIIPESIAALGFVILYWGSALSPFIYAVGLLCWMVLGGISLRGIFVGSHHLHEMGHALFLQVLGGPSVRESLAQYGEALSLKQIIPFSNIFIPGLSPAAEAPRMSVGNLPQGWKTRVTAFVGPAVNLLAVALLVPLSMVAEAGSAQSLALSFAGGVNLWMALMSISDFKMAFSGIGDALYCGNLGVLGKRRSEYKGMLPKEVDAILARMWKQIVVRGGQSGGRSILGKKGFVRSRLLNLKRAKLDQALRTSLKGEIFRRRATGSRPIDNFIEEIDHARFATGGPSQKGNAHPFVWGLVEGLWNALIPRKARVWTVEEGGILKNLRRVAQQIISHNGDFDAWIRQKGEAPIPNDWTLALAGWLTRALGRGDPSAGDSPKIAGMLELLLTQGQWGASFRLAYAMDVADSIDDVMKQSDVRKIGRSADRVFESWLKDAHVAGCRTLQDVFNQKGQKIDDLREELLNATRMDTQGLSQEKKELLVDRAIHYFFFNDLQEAGRFFSDRADGTFGMVLGSSLYPGEVVFGSFKQPIYVGIDPETESLVYASELSSVKAAGKPGKNQVTELLPYIYFMEKGEVAHFKIGEGDIPNSVAFSNGFAFLGPATFPDLSGSEMGGRHSLTEENLERWASEKEREGGRGWIGTRDNKNLSGGVSVADSADLVLDTLNDVPKVLATINADWAGQNPDSPNAGAAEDFTSAVLERARVRALTRYPGDAAYKNQLDVLVIGAEYGEYAGKHFAADLEGVFPGLKIDAVDSKAFGVDPEKFAIGPDTIVLAISHSGQYFHTVDGVSFLNALHERGRCGPVFGMAGLIDSVPLGQALGQSYKASAKSNRRLFVTHAGWRLDEPKPVVPLATEMTLSHLMTKIAEKAKNKKFGRTVSDDTVQRLKEGQSYLQERSESIFGINWKGQKVDAQEHKDLVAVGHHYSQRLTEFLLAMPLAMVHLCLVLYFGGNLIQGGFDLLFSLSQWGIFSDATTFGHIFVTYWQLPYFAMAYFVAAFVVRLVQRRPLWGRYVSAPTLFLGDTYFVHKTMEAYLRKLFSLSYGWAGWGEFKTGETRAGLVDEVNPSVKRGDFMFKGLPMQNGMHAMTQMISTQLRGSLSMNSTAEAFALGHQPPSHGKFDKHSVLAEEDSSRVEDVLGSEPDGGRLDLLESRVFSIERLMAFDVIFHANAARTRDWTNRFVLVLRWVAWPLFFLVRVISFGKFEVPLSPWDIAETHGRANIFTTQVGKPISVSVEKFSPRAFHLNGEPVAPRAPPPVSPELLAPLSERAEKGEELSGPAAPASASQERRENVGDVLSRGNSLAMPAEIQQGRSTRVSRATLFALATSLGMRQFTPDDTAVTLKKGIWDYLSDPANHSVRIIGQHEAALLGVLASHVDDPSLAVTIHLEGQSLPLSEYLAGWTAGPAPEYFDVSHNGGVHVMLIMADSAAEETPVVSPDQPAKKSSEISPNHGIDLAGYSALAQFLNIRTGELDNIGYLKTQIRGELKRRNVTQIPAHFALPLIEVLKGARDAQRSRVRVTSGEEIKELSLMGLTTRSANEIGVPHWQAFLVRHENGVFNLQEAILSEPSGVDQQDEPTELVSQLASKVTQEIQSNDLTEIPSSNREMDHQAALLELAIYLNLDVAEGESPVTVAEIIETHLRKNPGQEVQIPGEYQRGLFTVLERAMNREDNVTPSYFNNGDPKGYPIKLDRFQGRGNHQESIWPNYYVFFNNSLSGIESFSIFPHPRVPQEASLSVQGAASQIPEDQRPNNWSPRDYSEVSYEPPVAGIHNMSPEGNGQKLIPSESVPTATQEQRFETPRETRNEVSAENSPEKKGERDFFISIRDFTRNATRALIILLASIILLTSWGGAFLEKAITKLTGQPEAHEIRQDSSQTLDPKVVLSAETPRAFVNTKTSPLMAFDRSPAEKNPVVGWVRAHTPVKVLEHKGPWVFVSVGSGKRGWIKSQNIDGRGGKATLIRNVPLREHTPPVRVANLQKGAALAVLGFQGKWAHVAPLDNPGKSLWVSREYVSKPVIERPEPAGETPKETKGSRDRLGGGEKTISSTSGRNSSVTNAALALFLAPPLAPVLRQIGRRRQEGIGNLNTPGSVLHRRLLAGSLQEFEAGATREAAEALVSFVDHPGALHLDQTAQQRVLALGYGAVAGERWAQKGAPKDRALYDDYRRTRAILHRGPLSGKAGRALTRLARKASGWRLNNTPTFAPGALPVINLTEAGQDSPLLNDWAVAVARAAQGEPAPVVVARNLRQKEALVAALAAWRQAHPEVTLTDEAVGLSRWVYIDGLESAVVLRDEDGNPQTVRLGALLGTVHVDVGGLAGGIDVVTGAGATLKWDRSDVPRNIAVRLIMGLFNHLSLTAPLEEAEKELESVRAALKAA